MFLFKLNILGRENWPRNLEYIVSKIIQRDNEHLCTNK